MSRTNNNNFVVTFRRGIVFDLNSLPLLDFNDDQDHVGVQGGMPMPVPVPMPMPMPMIDLNVPVIDLNLPPPGVGVEPAVPIYRNMMEPDPADPEYPPPPPEEDDDDNSDDSQK